MSLVSNFIGGIGEITQGFGSTGVSGLDLNDTTFDDLFKKQLTGVEEKEGINSISNLLGVPSGFQIDALDGIEFSEKVQDQMEALGEKPNVSLEATPFDMSKDSEITSSETVTFFSSLLDNAGKGNDKHTEVFDFAKKQAANLYSRYSRSVVTDVQEFVHDIHGLMS